MLDMPCGLLLLQPPVLWLSGLPGPPEDSLSVPRDWGLLAPVGPLLGGSFGATGSNWFAVFDSFRPSATKLPTTTCNGFCNHKITVSIMFNHMKTLHLAVLILLINSLFSKKQIYRIGPVQC